MIHSRTAREGNAPYAFNHVACSNGSGRIAGIYSAIPSGAPSDYGFSSCSALLRDTPRPHSGFEQRNGGGLVEIQYQKVTTYHREGRHVPTDLSFRVICTVRFTR